MKHLIALLFLAGCLGDVDLELAPTCVFDGEYEFGGIPAQVTDECLPFTRVSRSDGLWDACETEVEALSGYLECEPGDPVTECHGYGSLPAPCEFELYVSRIGP